MTDKAEKILESAQSNMANRNYAKAIKNYNDYLKLEPDDMKATYTLADAYTFEGDMKMAIALYIRVANYLRTQGFIMKSIAVCKRVLNLDENNFDAKDLLKLLYQDKSTEDSGSISTETEKTPAAEKEEEPSLIKMNTLPQEALPSQPDYEGKDEISVSGGQAVSAELSGAEQSSELIYKETMPVRKVTDPSDLKPNGFQEDFDLPSDITGEFIALDGSQINVGDSINDHPKRTDTQEFRILEAKDLLFDQLDKEEYMKIIDRMEFKKYEAGEMIVKEGDPGDSMFIICSGSVTVKTLDKEGKEVKLANLDEGNFFGEVSLLTGKPRTATIYSKDTTELLELKNSELPEIESAYPGIRRKLENFYHRRTMHTIETLIASDNLK